MPSEFADKSPDLDVIDQVKKFLIWAEQQSRTNNAPLTPEQQATFVRSTFYFLCPVFESKEYLGSKLNSLLQPTIGKKVRGGFVDIIYRKVAKRKGGTRSRK